MPVLTQQDINRLSGLKASDRSVEEQQSINEVMGYQNRYPSASQDILEPNEPEIDKNEVASAYRKRLDAYVFDMHDKYKKALEKNRQELGVNRNSVNTSANEYIDKIASEVSSHYKKYNGTDKLPLTDKQKKEIAAEYDARKETYGEDNAAIWLDNQMKDIVGENQSWFEQMWNGVSHLVPAIEGGLIQTIGTTYAALKPFTPIGWAMNALDVDDGLDDNPDLSIWDNYIDNILDNPLTRYGRDIEMSGASHVSNVLNFLGLSDNTAEKAMEDRAATATKYNPEGIGNDAIITTQEQDDSWISTATPWRALQSGGFTALSMMVGAGEAKFANWIFSGLAKGNRFTRAFIKPLAGVEGLHNAGWAFRTEKGLERALEGLKKAQNFANLTVIPGAVGTIEGAMEGLNTKIEVERKGIEELDNFYKEKVDKEAQELYNSDTLNPLIEIETDQGKIARRKYATPEEAYEAVWNKYQDEYVDSRRQIDWAASHAGQHNFIINSLINGALNATLKAGIMAPRVQETIRNSKVLGWAYKGSKFNLDEATGAVTPKISKARSVLQVLKEPFGEGLEEYAQNLSDETFSGAAENNIHEFIQRRFDPEGAVKVGDDFSSDYAATLTSLTNALTDKESLESMMLGAISSTMGTVGGIGRGYHRDEKTGKIVQNSLLDPRNFTRGLNAEGQKEGWLDYARRVTPWRSGMINAVFDVRKENQEAREAAAQLQEWYKDSQNRAKWDGLQGTANWMSKMLNDTESNDQFSYRNSQMGKAINDVFMISKLKGTQFYESMMTDLQRASDGNISEEEIEAIRKNGGEEYAEKSNEEIVGKIQSNANKMLGLMSSVEKEGRRLDRMLGRIDEDTKQALIYGKLMEADHAERRDELGKKVNEYKSRIKSSVSNSNSGLTEQQKKVMLRHGSLNRALEAEEELEKDKKKVQEKIDEIEAIDDTKRTKSLNKELKRKKQELKTIDKKLEEFKSIHSLVDKNGKKKEDTPADLVLSEQEIMDLDPVTRAIVLAEGGKKYYNATHQNKKKVDRLNLEIDALDQQIEAEEQKKARWTDSNGKAKKRHNKQVKKAEQKIAELKKQRNEKQRDLDVEQGRLDTKPVYNAAQQAVIDNLISQGTSIDPDFMDNVVDMGRLDGSIKNYHSEYQAILSDPKAFGKYVRREKQKAAMNLTRRRAERLGRIEDYKEFAEEFDRMTANASILDKQIILQTLREQDARRKNKIRKEREKAKQQRQEAQEIAEEQAAANISETSEPVLDLTENAEQQEGEPIPVEAVPVEGQPVEDQPIEATVVEQEEIEEDEEETFPESNFEKYMKTLEEREKLMSQYRKLPNLDANDISLLDDAMQYVSNQGISVTDREGVVQALVEADDLGVQGGKFRRWVESKNEERLPQQRSVFTSIADVVNNYVDLLNGKERDDINEKKVNPTVVIGAPEMTQEEERAAQDKAAKVEAAKAGIMAMGEASKNHQDAVREDDNPPESNSQVESVEKQQQKESLRKKPLTEIEKAFSESMSPEMASELNSIGEHINNSNGSNEAKQLAMQYFMSLSVNGEKYSTMDEFINDLASKVEELKKEDATTEEDKRLIGEAVGILSKAQSAFNKKHKRRRRRRSLPATSTAPNNENARWIATLNMNYMLEEYPDSWASQFYEGHHVEEWLRDNRPDANTTIYFLTDSEWTAEVIRKWDDSRGRHYNQQSDMPVVAAVRVEAPVDPHNTDAIEADGLWYQPIAILPSKEFEMKHSGMGRTGQIRALASQGQGTHLITADGTPTGALLTSRILNPSKAISAHSADQTDTRRTNDENNNKDFIDAILDTFTGSEWNELAGLSKEQLLADERYATRRSKRMVNRENGLIWIEDHPIPELSNNLFFRPDNFNENEPASPMLVRDKPMATTEGRTTDKTLEEVLKEGTDDEVVTFNSRTQKVFDTIILPLFQHVNSRTSNREAQLRPENIEAEKERIRKALHRITNYIWIKNWEIKVDYDEVDGADGPESHYKISLKSLESSELPEIELGTIIAKEGRNNIAAAKQFLRNLLYDPSTETVRNFLRWQRPKEDVKNLRHPDRKIAEDARRNIAAIIDDGILEFAGSAIDYDIDGIKLRAPINSENKPIYTEKRVANPDNANQGAPQNVTLQAEGAVLTNDGKQVEPNSGVTVGDDNNSPAPLPPAPGSNQGPEGGNGRKKTAAELKAEAIVEKMKAVAKRFRLSDDEITYVEIDPATGEAIPGSEHLRVTTLIEADRSLPDFTTEEQERMWQMESRWTPSLKEVVEKLKGRFAIPNIPDALLRTTKDTNTMSQLLNIPASEIRRAVAELRTEHKKTKYGVWSTPSTSIGNTQDAIVRDFFAGTLKDSYPNITQQALANFVRQLQFFKDDLDSKNITIVSEDIMAIGNITMTDSEGTEKVIKAAGTLDLFGYDDKGNFYIFDMKTLRANNLKTDKDFKKKLESNKAKWSRQISMYADMLEQTFGIKVDKDNLRIVPIKIYYDPPLGNPKKQLGTSLAGPVYSEVKEGEKKGQLQMTYRGTTKAKDFDGSNPELASVTVDGLFGTGYTKFNLNWDNLSSEDQDAAAIIEAEVERKEGRGPASPQQGKEEGKEEGAPKGRPTSTVSIPTMNGGVTREVPGFKIDKKDIKKGDIIGYSGRESSNVIDYGTIETIQGDDVVIVTGFGSKILPSDRTYYKLDLSTQPNQQEGKPEGKPSGTVDEEGKGEPKSATIETPERKSPSFMAASNYGSVAEGKTGKAPTVRSNGIKAPTLSWEGLSDEEKERIWDVYNISDESTFADTEKEDPATWKSIQKTIRCMRRGS